VGLHNVKKIEHMEVGQCISDDICINGEAIKIVNNVCIVRSFISDNCNCDNEIRSRLVKANSTFGHHEK